jgi:endonuclease/exonuclease/phosphatase family metal-dependent hydrolase
MDFLAAVTGMPAIVGLTIIRHEGHYGNALLTRRPVLTVRRHDISVSRREPRGALDVDLDVPGATLRVVIAHLGLRPAERRCQVTRLLQVLRDVPLARSIVLLGDINEWPPFGRPLRWIHQLLGKPPAQPTFPARIPLFTLDRVWVHPHSALLVCSVHRSAQARRASDHLPVKAIIAVPRAGSHAV